MKHTEEYYEGFSDYEYKCDNPYLSDTQEYNDWQEGYSDAEAYLESMKLN